jgi:hypothetical protein
MARWSMIGSDGAEAVSGTSAGGVTELAVVFGSRCGAGVSAATRGRAWAAAVSLAPLSWPAPDCGVELWRLCWPPIPAPAALS